MDKKHGFSTRALHSDHGDTPHRAHSFPIFMSSSFCFDSAEQGAAIFAGAEKGFIYTRISNPTTLATERALAEMEEAESAVVFASGMAAITAALMTHLKCGDHIVAAGAMYGPTVNLCRDFLPRYGITSTIVGDVTAPENFAAAICKETKMILLETPANPTLDIVDIAAVAGIAHSRGIKVAVDNTFATPYLTRPLEHGADIVIHSATKYLNGHADIVAGAVCGPASLVEPIRKFRTETGAVQSPFESFLMLRGMRTLALRMERHCSNALALALFLKSHPAVDRVYYPGLPDHPGHEVARRQMRNWGGMISFELKGGYAAGVKMLNSLHLLTVVVSLGTLDTIIQHPASMTHSKVPANVRAASGITDGLVRLSVGIEDITDLIED
ncbi:MAG: aminotransferase class I/II-fold pyridoxal phosphate-dependent enzyme, partial [Candidatus Brocadiia bacterium]